jgi:hypothetical protein
MTLRRRSARLTGRGRVRGKATVGKPSSAAAGSLKGTVQATGTLQSSPPSSIWLQPGWLQEASPLTATASPAGSVQATGVIYNEPMPWEEIMQGDMRQ